VSRVGLGSFVVDIVSGELWSAGAEGGRERIVLREQPLRVLRLLIEYDGRVATREEIRKKLWPNDTIVDFDHSINVAIGSLRRALGDSADNPQYIETLARRGYRLVVAAEWLEPGLAAPAAPGAEAATEPLGLIGKKVSHYRVISAIGGGGMGMVYQAEDLKLGRRVALKFLPEELADDPAALGLLQREAQTASALNHPNICTIYEIEEHDGQPFIAMELLEGETVLERLTSRPGPMPLPELVDLGVQVCNGLQAAHGRGIIHRDIKPPNIFLTRQGPVKILDFGVAKLAEAEDIAGAHAAESSEGIRPGSITAIGTPSYMSPEQVRKERLDTRTDLFSLGLVLYQMAAGRRAFEGDTEEAIHDAILVVTPEPARAYNPAVPEGLDRVLARALEKDRTRRYQSAAELREDLLGLLTETRPSRARSRRWASTAAVAVLAAGLGLYSSLHRSVTLSDTDTIVLADLRNETEDTVLDAGLNAGLRVGLGQTPYLSVLAAEKVVGTLRLLNLPPTTKLTPDIALRVCGRTNSRMVVGGTIADEGNRYRIELSALDCQSKRQVARAEEEAGGRKEIVHTLGVTAARLREMLGEPETSIARFNQPLELATSSSPEALQQVVLGYQHHVSTNYQEAAANYRHAIELDSNFALAYGALATALQQFDPLGSMKAGMKSYELRDRLIVPNRLRAEFGYNNLVVGDQEKACAVAKQWAQTFPRDYPAHIDFAICLKLLGQPDRALAEIREAVRLLPSVQSYLWEAELSIVAGRVQEAKAALDQASASGSDIIEVHYERGRVSFLEGDTAVMHAQMRWAEGKPGAAPIFIGESEFEAYHGRFHRARALLQRALALGPQGGLLPTMIARSVLREAEVGNAARARHVADSLIKGASDNDATLILMLALARGGSVTAARAYADSFARRFLRNTVVQKFYLPTIYGAISLEEHDPAGAIEALRPAVPYDFVLAEVWPNEPPVYPSYVRGLSYLQLHDGKRAAAEFQKLLDHPGLVGRSVTGALARLQLARAQQMAGDTAAALGSYERFLSLWQDADPEIPIYQAARAEYARLKKGVIRGAPPTS
jgi:serine/threonine protein kinase/Tfp pilus assembly protein PilF